MSPAAHAGFVPLSQALSALPGVQEQHTHALFRFLDTACAGAVPVEELSDAIYGPLRPAQLGLVQAAFEARPPPLRLRACCAPHEQEC